MMNEKIKSFVPEGVELELFKSMQLFEDSIFKDTIKQLLFFDINKEDENSIYIEYLLKQELINRNVDIFIDIENKILILRSKKNLPIILDFENNSIFTIPGDEYNNYDYITNILSSFEESCRTVLANIVFFNSVKSKKLTTTEARKILMLLPYIKITSEFFRENEYYYSITDPMGGHKIILDECGKLTTFQKFDSMYEIYIFETVNKYKDIWNNRWNIVGVNVNEIPKEIRDWRIK